MDGIGGTVKRLVWLVVILAGGSCRSAEHFIKIVRNKTKKINLFEITKTDVDYSKVKLEHIFQTTISIPQTFKMHLVQIVEKNTLEFPYYSMSCEKQNNKLSMVDDVWSY